MIIAIAVSISKQVEGEKEKKKGLVEVVVVFLEALSYGDNSRDSKRHAGNECQADNSSGHVQAPQAVHSVSLFGERGTGHGGGSSNSSSHAE
jgi:hypothetical protein